MKLIRKGTPEWKHTRRAIEQNSAGLHLPCRAEGRRLVNSFGVTFGEMTDARHADMVARALNSWHKRGGT